jgi:hypothetical protein
MNHGLIAQTDKSNWVGVNASISSGVLMRFGGALDGGLSYNGDIGFLFGIGYSRLINDKLDFEIGIDYSRNSFDYVYTDGEGQVIYSVSPENIDLLTIPVNIKIKFKKQFFLSTGIQYDQRFMSIKSPTIDNQSGIGLNLKFGRDFKITDKMILSLAPEIIIHCIIPFYPENNQQRLTEIGLRISYRFGV